jgi:hypothetical protein
MRKWLPLVLLSATAVVAPAPRADEPAEIVAETSLRRDPEASGLAGLLIPGTPVSVVETSGEWVKVRLEGWVRASAVGPGAPPAAAAVAQVATAATPPAPPPVVAPAELSAPQLAHAAPPPPAAAPRIVIPVEGLVRLKLGALRRVTGEGASVLLLPAGTDLDPRGPDAELDARVVEIEAEAARLKREADAALHKTSNFTEASRENDRLMDQHDALLRERGELLAQRHGRHEVLARGAAVASATTDSKGWFSLEAPPGEYVLYARLTSKSLDLEWILPLRAEDRPVEVDLNEETALGLPPR